MNLLDQLYQYSLRGDSSSLSFSALENEQNLELSSISQHSFTQSMISSTLGVIPGSQQDKKSGGIALNFQENLFLTNQMETYIRVKEKYTKLSKIVEMFGNKIRKIQYEFLVKLQNKYKDTFKFQMGNERHYEQLKISKKNNEVSKDFSVIFRSKIQPIHNKKVNHLLRLGFTAILKKSMCQEKLQYLCCCLNSLLAIRSKLHFKHFFNILKHKPTQLKRNLPKELFLKSKKIAIKQEIQIFSSFNQKQKSFFKLPIVHPQRREIQNIDICDSLSMFFLFNQQIFQNNPTQSEALQTSIIKNISENDYKTQKRRSDITNVSRTASQVEDCTKLHTQYQLDQKFCYQVPLLGLSQSACFKDSSNTNMIAQENQQIMLIDELKHQNLGYRFSLQDHQSQLNKYIIFRRSIEKKKDSTLKNIEKSKETIKKIVYQLKKSKAKNEKQRIKLTSKKLGFKNKSSEKKAHNEQSKACSPIRPKTIGNKSSRATPSKKYTQVLENKIFTTRDNQTSQNHVFEDFQQYQTTSKNIQVYYNYMKAKKKSIKIDETSNKKGSIKPPLQGSSSKKNKTAKHNNAQNNLLIISIDPMLRGRRIDVKVDLAKPSANGRLQVEKAKGSGKKNKK